MHEHLKRNIYLSACEKNKLAYNYIMEDNFEEAYQLLVENYKQEPCVQTANNLAYYYLNIGEVLEDGRMYLQPLKAIDILVGKYEHYFPLSILGHSYYQIKDYKKSLECFAKAQKCSSDISAMINYALLLYCNSFVKLAEEIFLRICQSDLDNKYIKYCYLFCKLLVDKQYVNGKKDIMLLEKEYMEKKTDDNIDILDICYLYFLSDSYERVIYLYTNLSKDYFLNPLDFHIMAYAMNCLQLQDSIKQLYYQMIEEYTECYSKPMFDKIDELNHIYNQKLFTRKPEIRLNVRLDAPCYFFGCVKHNICWEF